MKSEDLAAKDVRAKAASSVMEGSVGAGTPRNGMGGTPAGNGSGSATTPASNSTQPAAVGGASASTAPSVTCGLTATPPSTACTAGMMTGLAGCAVGPNRSNAATPTAASVNGNGPAIPTSTSPLEGLDMFDLQLRRDRAGEFPATSSTHIQPLRPVPFFAPLNFSPFNTTAVHGPFPAGSTPPHANGPPHSQPQQPPQHKVEQQQPVTGQTAHGASMRCANASPSFACLADSIVGRSVGDTQSRRLVLLDIVRSVFRHAGETCPEDLSEDQATSIAFTLIEELQRHRGSPPFPSPRSLSALGVSNGTATNSAAAARGSPYTANDGRSTIAKEIVWADSRDAPPGSDLPRPAHPYSHAPGSTCSGNGVLTGICAAVGASYVNISPSFFPSPHQGGCGNGVTGVAWKPGMQTMVPRIPSNVSPTTPAYYTASPSNPSVAPPQHKGVFLRPRPQHITLSKVAQVISPNQVTSMSGANANSSAVAPSLPVSSSAGFVGPKLTQRQMNGKKVLRSASSAFSECSTGDTGDVSSSMSRTTAGTTTITLR